MPPFFKNQVVHLVTGGDMNFAAGIQVALVSALLHLKTSHSVAIHVLDGGLHEASKNKIKDSCLSIRKQCTVTFYPVSEKSFATFSSGPNGSRMFYARLAMPEILHDVEKVIYLDADTLVINDLMILWNWDLKDQFALVCRDRKVQKLREDCPWQLCDEELDFPYFNTGLMVVNLSKWREVGILGAAQIAAEQVEGKLQWWDQTLLNYLLRRRVGFLPQQWNWQHEHLPENGDPIRIIHFTANKKPWLYYGCEERFRIWRHIYSLHGGSIWHLLKLRGGISQLFAGIWDALVESSKLCRNIQLNFLRIKKLFFKGDKKTDLIKNSALYYTQAPYLNKFKYSYYFTNVRNITKHLAL
jgi:lipopolysaccharide biosynthesis glycosyltransferase